MLNKLQIIGLCVVINANCFAITNNHNNKYDPNTIYTSTQYMIDTDPDLVNDEKQVMLLSKDLYNPKSQHSIIFNWSINQQIKNKLKEKKILLVDDFRKIIDSLISDNIGNLPVNADEVRNLNKVLTKFTLNILLSKMIGNNINIKEHNLLLLSNKENNINSIFGDGYCNSEKELDNINYKNKRCFFKITNNCNEFYYTVNLK